MLQAIVSYNIWIWNAHFGIARSNNNLNVLKETSIIEDVISRDASIASFYANGNCHPRGYFLGDEIYPEYPIFVKTLQNQLMKIEHTLRRFKNHQERISSGVLVCFNNVDNL